jgi:hypothetical protein
MADLNSVTPIRNSFLTPIRSYLRHDNGYNKRYPPMVTRASLHVRTETVKEFYVGWVVPTGHKRYEAQHWWHPNLLIVGLRKLSSTYKVR